MHRKKGQTNISDFLLIILSDWVPVKQDKLYKLKTELQTQQCDAQICQKINSQDLTAAGLDLVTQKYKEGVDMWSRWVVLRICMDLYGFVWIFMDFYGFVWICMDLYGIV